MRTEISPVVGTNYATRFSQAAAFLRVVTDPMPDEFRLNLWQMSSDGSGGVSIWIGKNDLKAGAEWVAESSKNTYMAKAFSDRGHQRFERMSTERASALGLFSLDIDCHTPYRGRKDNLARNKHHALEIVKDLPVQPQYLIFTGGGLQPIYQSSEMYVLDSITEQRQVEMYIRQFEDAMRSHIWDRHRVLIDRTTDLARQIRMPGSVNIKANEEVRFIPWPQGWNK